MKTEQMTQAMVDQMVQEALAVCAEMHFSGDLQQAIESLRSGQCDVILDFSSSIGGQIAKYLGQIDKTVKAVYEYHIDPGAMRAQEGDLASAWVVGINLVAWVERKSAALEALVATLELVLSQSLQGLGLIDRDTVHIPLDVKMIDDGNIRERRGYGVIASSEIIRSSRVWPRIEE
jgi:hypothetical protein